MEPCFNPLYVEHFLYMNYLEEDCEHLLEILNGKKLKYMAGPYGMKLKLGPVITLDKRRRYMTLSLWSQTVYVIYGPETFLK